MITIKQIALKAGVSPTTVSNVLHGRTDKVSPDTLRRVQLFLKAEKYAPNMGAIMLGQNKSLLIGVIIFLSTRSGETLIEDPFTGALIGSLERQIRRSNYFMILYTTDNSDEVINLCSYWKLAGLIILGVSESMAATIKKQTDTPVVFIDGYFHDDNQLYHNVGLNDRGALYDMTKHVLALGHKHIVFFAERKRPHTVDRERLKGFFCAIRDAGLQYHAKMYIPLSMQSSERHAFYKNLYEKKSSVTALLFSSDYYASDCIAYFKSQNIKIPDRFSITGFDNNRVSRIIEPALTTVNQDTAKKGEKAVKMLVSLIRNEKIYVTNIQLQTQLIKRDSVKSLL